MSTLGSVARAACLIFGVYAVALAVNDPGWSWWALAGGVGVGLYTGTEPKR